MKYQINTYNRNTTDQELLEDLKIVALKIGDNKITKSSYNENGKYSSGTFERRFGSWNKALKKADLQVHLQQNISDLDLFVNIEQVWLQLGRQPLYSELKRPLSKYSKGPYEKRFGTWLKALEAFVDFIDTEDEQNIENEECITTDIIQNTVMEYKHKTQRQPNGRLKLQVLIRDGNKCRLCGVTITGENIHFDHIKPWSKGGETTLENLQVLCEEHNLAKGNLDYEP